MCLKFYEYEFMELACQCPAVVCCRCAPTQKAQIVRLLQERTGKLTCAVGESAQCQPQALIYWDITVYRVTELTNSLLSIQLTKTLQLQLTAGLLTCTF